MGFPTHKTKIVCTIGPASESIEVMEQMLKAGMNVARINFSHGSFDNHAAVIRNLRLAARRTKRRLAIMADLPGPKMRIGELRDEPVFLNAGDSLVVTADPIVGDASKVSMSFTRLPVVVKPKDTLYLNDGNIQLEVRSVAGSDVHCRVVVGGELRSHKGLNLPGIDLGISAFTDRDFECLKFSIENGVDAVSQSFVEKGDDIEAVRRAAANLGRVPFIIAKIERSRALDHIEEIIDAADGIMIARGDLGVEVPIEQIAVIQKDVMRRANVHGKPVITATQMLESMIANSRPTRAESTDVANAILDGTDCVMLSGESAMGGFPVDAVTMLARIASAVEPRLRPFPVRDMVRCVDHNLKLRPPHCIAIAVEATLEYSAPAAVFVPTKSGSTARNITRFRLPVWTVAVSRHAQTCQALQFSYGVHPVQEDDHPEDWKSYVRRWLSENGLPGDMAVVTEGPSTKHPEANHRMEIIDLSH